MNHSVDGKTEGKTELNVNNFFYMVKHIRSVRVVKYDSYALSSNNLRSTFVHIRLNLISEQLWSVVVYSCC